LEVLVCVASVMSLPATRPTRAPSMAPLLPMSCRAVSRVRSLLAMRPVLPMFSARMSVTLRPRIVPLLARSPCSCRHAVAGHQGAVGAQVAFAHAHVHLGHEHALHAAVGQAHVLRDEPDHVGGQQAHLRFGQRYAECQAILPAELGAGVERRQVLGFGVTSYFASLFPAPLRWSPTPSGREHIWRRWHTLRSQKHVLKHRQFRN
jgi:hypothetical protein